MGGQRGPLEAVSVAFKRQGQGRGGAAAAQPFRGAGRRSQR